MAPTPDAAWAYLPAVPDSAPVLFVCEPETSARRFAQRALRLWLGTNDYSPAGRLSEICPFLGTTADSVIESL
jgi:hypothetical protein